jgi:hypothetical protein
VARCFSRAEATKDLANASNACHSTIGDHRLLAHRNAVNIVSLKAQAWQAFSPQRVMKAV